MMDMPPDARAAAERTTAGELETEALGAAIGRELRGGDVLALEGPLGAGKTRLVRGIAAGLGLDPREVSSPTYVLVQEYGPSPSGLTIAHADAYRLDDSASLESIGWDEFVGDPDVVTIVEWASRIAGALPPTTAWIDIAFDAEDAGDVGDADGPGDRRVISVRETDGAEGDAVRRVRAGLAKP